MLVLAQHIPFSPLLNLFDCPRLLLTFLLCVSNLTSKIDVVSFLPRRTVSANVRLLLPSV
jgi:hypothetical protein